MRRISLAASIFILSFLLLGGCASSFARRATRATGLCDGRRVLVSDVSEDGGSVGWTAECENTIGRFDCVALGEGDDAYDVTCEYQPICGNDRHYETRTATVER
jgi:hypothetical protein